MIRLIIFRKFHDFYFLPLDFDLESFILSFLKLVLKLEFKVYNFIRFEFERLKLLKNILTMMQTK